MGKCFDNADCVVDHYCNPVFKDCQHCNVPCHPGRKQFGECEKHCQGYVHSTTRKVGTTPNHEMASSQHKSTTPRTSHGTALAVTVIVILMVLVIILVVILVVIIGRYLHSAKQSGYFSQNMKAEYQGPTTDGFQVFEDNSSKITSQIYTGGNINRKISDPSKVWNSSLKAKAEWGKTGMESQCLIHNKTAEKPSPLSLEHTTGRYIPTEQPTPQSVGHISGRYIPTEQLQSPGHTSGKKIPTEQSINNQSLTVETFSQECGPLHNSAFDGESPLQLTGNHKSTSLFPNCESISSCRSEKLGISANTSHNSSNIQQGRVSLANPDRFSSTTHQSNSNCGNITSVIVENVSSAYNSSNLHGEAPYNTLQKQEVFSAINFRHITESRDDNNNEEAGQETLLKQLSTQMEAFEESREESKFTLDASPDIEQKHTQQEKKLPMMPHPNRAIYDVLKGIDWVQGYYSEGRSIEVYTDLNHISEEVAMKELTVRTGVAPEKFHLRPSDINSY